MRFETRLFCPYCSWSTARYRRSWNGKRVYSGWLRLRWHIATEHQQAQAEPVGWTEKTEPTWAVGVAA